MPAHESMEDTLARVRDGWTVKARFKTRDGHAIVEGVVRAGFNDLYPTLAGLFNAGQGDV